ncbi:MAG: MFS transporter [Syntrophothermus sp.]
MIQPASEDKTQKRITLLVTTLSSFITPFMGSAINIGLPAIGHEFNITAVMLSWVATSYLLATAVFLVPAGKIADIYGRKRIFAAGILIFTAAAFMCATAGSPFILISWRILQGIGSAMIFGTSTAILTSVFPLGERGKALGINVATVYTGLSVGPFIGGILTQNLGWRYIFFCTIPLGIIVFLVLMKLKGEWADAKGEKLDVKGAVVFVLMLICLMYGFSQLPSKNGILLMAAGILGLLTFIRIETSIGNPVLNISLFRENVTFTFSNIAALINYSATSAVAFLLSLYLQYIKLMTPQQAGIILVAQPVFMALVSPFAGRLSDKAEPRIISSVGMAIIAVGLFMLFFVGQETSTAYIIAGLVFLGIGFGLFSSPNTNAIMSSVEKRFYGVASATLATMRLSGQMMSMAFSIMIFSIFIGNVRVAPSNFAAFIMGVKVLFLIFALLCVLGIFASLARGKLR